MKRRPRILLLEDNVNFGLRIYDDLVRVGQTSWLNTESEFEKYWQLIEAEPPDVAVLDIMLAGDVPTRDAESVHERKKRDLYKAGIICARRFAEKMPHVRIVFYTVVPAEDLQEQLDQLAAQMPSVTYVQKPSEIGVVVANIVALIPDEIPVAH